MATNLSSIVLPRDVMKKGALDGGVWLKGVVVRIRRRNPSNSTTDLIPGGESKSSVKGKKTK